MDERAVPLAQPAAGPGHPRSPGSESAAPAAYPAVGGLSASRALTAQERQVGGPHGRADRPRVQSRRRRPAAGPAVSLLECDTIDQGRREVRGWLKRRGAWRAADILPRDGLNRTHVGRWTNDADLSRSRRFHGARRRNGAVTGWRDSGSAGRGPGRPADPVGLRHLLARVRRARPAQPREGPLGQVARAPQDRGAVRPRAGGASGVHHLQRVRHRHRRRRPPRHPNDRLRSLVRQAEHKITELWGTPTPTPKEGRVRCAMRSRWAGCTPCSPAWWSAAPIVRMHYHRHDDTMMVELVQADVLDEIRVLDHLLVEFDGSDDDAY